VISKAFFYTKPDESTKRTAHIVHWNNALLTPIKEENDFFYIVFTNHFGQTSKGWLRKKDVVRVADE
jgi:serine/threonine-protein kinase